MATSSLKSLRETADLRHLRQIIVGLDEGVILIDPDQSLLWANDAALAMHGVAEIADLGATVDEYRARFQLRYRNNTGWKQTIIRSTASSPAMRFRKWSSR